MTPPVVPFPPVQIATKLLVALGIGLLIGFEREWAHKDQGVRTFAVITLLGMLSALISDGVVLAGFGGVVALVAIVNVGNFVHTRQAEVTTSGALLVTFLLGVLVGEGHVFTPTATAIVMTLLLALKPQFSRFAGGLTAEEVRGAVLLGLIGFVVYPVLPNRFIDPWELLNPREAWLTIILIAALGFLNYILLRLFSTRGIYYAAVFGGLVNSTATIAELSGAVKAAGSAGTSTGVVINLLTIVAMFVRNLALLSVFSPHAGLIALWPILVMALSATGFAWWQNRTPGESPSLKIASPFEVRSITGFGLLFVIIQVAGSLGQRFLGNYGTIGVGILGGFVSSASTTAAAASLAMHGRITPETAALSTVVTSIASTLVNLPIVYRATKDRRLIRILLLISVVITALGLSVLGLVGFLSHRFSR
jgi:uncharacterized membrane protein (DUF4010 family)